MAISEAELAKLIQDTFDTFSDMDIDPAAARKKQAEDIAHAIMLFVIGRQTIVTGTSATGGPVTGTGVIQI